ncbi:MAG: S8 family serine peptidase [Coprococcus sp.]
MNSIRNVIKRWLALLLTVVVITGYFDIYCDEVNAAEATEAEAVHNSQSIEACENPEVAEITEDADSAMEVMELLSENASVDYSVDEIDSPFALKCLVLTADNLQDTYGASDIIHYEAYDEYILSFETIRDTEYAYYEICDDYGEYSCFPDQIIETDDMLMDVSDVEPAECNSWGTEYMGLDYLKSAYNYYDINQQVKVAVIDSGIIPDREIFAGRIDMENSYNFYSQDDNIIDNMGHGTHVAGIIADATPKNVQLVILRCWDNGSSTNLAIMTSLQHAIDMKVDIVNMSLGWYSASGNFNIENENSFFFKFNRVIDEAVNRNIVICCAAGNNASGNKNPDVKCSYPANNSSVITVTALTKNSDNIVEFAKEYSSYGDTVDYAAPGTAILSEALNGKEKKNGTSMASPHVAAAAAYIKMIEPGADTTIVEKRLSRYAVDLGEPGWDKYYGNGYINLRTYFKDCGLRKRGELATKTDANPVTDKVLPVLSFKNGTVNKNYGNADFTNELTDNSDGTVSYTTSNRTVATVDDNGIVHIVGAGTCIITAELLETDRFLGTSASYTLDVSKIDLTRKTVKLSQTVYTYDGKACKPDVIINGVTADNYKVSYSGYNKVGTALATITGTGNYTGTVVLSYRINPADAQITSASNTSKGIKLVWNRVKGAAGYRVYRKTSSSSYKCIAKLTGATARTYIDKTAKSGTKYTYMVRAYNGNVIGSEKNNKSLTRLDTTVVTAVNRPAGIRVAWSKVNGAAGYKVYRKTGGGSYILIAKVKSSKTAYIDRKAVVGTLNKYIIIPYKGATNAAKSSATRAVRRR